MTGPASGYQGALDFLYARTTGDIRPGLERTRALLAALGDPQERVPAFHVAGTNGKGSTCAMLEALLRASGLRVAKYTSPHLVDFRERMLVNGVPPSEHDVEAWIARHAALCEGLGATFFEATTALAFDHFAGAGADVAVIETGLGGRLDSTNVLRAPLAAAVTSIGVDHIEYLGADIASIATEKAGIFKAGAPAIIGAMAPAATSVCRLRAEAVGARPVVVHGEALRVDGVLVDAAGTQFTLTLGAATERMSTALVGRHQASNAAVALAMLDAAGERYRPPSLADATRALNAVTLAGRFERRGRWIHDVAHNPEGAAALAATVGAADVARPMVTLLTVLADKDWRGVMRALAPVTDQFMLTLAPTAPRARAWNPREALAYAQAEGWEATLEPSFDRALARAEQVGATVLVTGSFHTVGDAMARLQHSPLPG